MFEHFNRTKTEKRHWCPRSEQYAGGDVLYNYLNNGWAVRDGLVVRQYIWQGGARRMVVFHFELERQKEIIKLSVVQNPFIDRVIAANNLHISDTTGQQTPQETKTVYTQP